MLLFLLYHLTFCFVFYFIIETSKMNCLVILILIGCIVRLESCKFCVFNEEIIVCNDGVEFTYKSECRYYCAMLLPIAAMSTKIEKEMKYQRAQPQPQTKAQWGHETQHPDDKQFSFDPTDARSGEFDDLEYIFDVLCKDIFNCDINNFFKYWCKNFNGHYDCNRYNTSAGMLALVFYFFSCRCTQYASCWI